MFGVVLKRLHKYLQGTVQYSTVLQCKIASHACHVQWRTSRSHTGHGVGRIVVVIGTIIVRRMRTSERTYEPRMRAYVRRRGRPTPCAVA